MNITDKDIFESAVVIVKTLIERRCLDQDTACDYFQEYCDNLSKYANDVAEEQKPLIPAVPINKSITPDFIICLEDGKKYKSLKRHIKTHYDLTPEEYREKWSLPHDYPMVSPNYAKARSKLAKKMGLGVRGEGGVLATAKKSKANGKQRMNGSSTRMVGAERGTNPAPS